MKNNIWKSWNAVFQNKLRFRNKKKKKKKNKTKLTHVRTPPYTPRTYSPPYIFFFKRKNGEQKKRKKREKTNTLNLTSPEYCGSSTFQLSTSRADDLWYYFVFNQTACYSERQNGTAATEEGTKEEKTGEKKTGRNRKEKKTKNTLGKSGKHWTEPPTRLQIYIYTCIPINISINLYFYIYISRGFYFPLLKPNVLLK